MKVTVTPIMLIVDGNSECRLILKGIFDKTYHILEAGTCAEAMKQLRGEVQVDIVVLDIDTPDIQGFTSITKICKSQVMNHIPVVVVTNCDDMWVKRKALQMGALDVITKPYTPKIFQYHVKNILSSIKKTVNWKKQSGALR